MENTFSVTAIYPTGEKITWENVTTVTSNLHGYLMSYTDSETGEYRQHQFESWQTVSLSLHHAK